MVAGQWAYQSDREERLAAIKRMLKVRRESPGAVRFILTCELALSMNYFTSLALLTLNNF